MELTMPTMRKIWALLVISLSTFTYVEAVPKKQVCVIGAGRAGLAAIKIAIDQTKAFEAIAFERNSDVGGLWIYRDDPELDEHGLPAHSGIYKHLRTVSTKDDMTYPDYETFPGGDSHGYVSHEEFLEYMRNYTDRFQLRKYIQFDTLVTKVKPHKEENNVGTMRWYLKKQHINSYKAEGIVCDGVVVCNGRYSKPNIPDIPGLGEFPGRVLHSRSYRIPDDFANKTVVVLGAGLSGKGITRDLATRAKTVYFSIKTTYRNTLPKNVKVVSNVVAAKGSELFLEDNTKITDADALIFCTGYVYDFPFLDERSGIDLWDRYHLTPLKKQFINKLHPSMAFIGLGADNSFADFYYSEMKYFLKSLLKA